MRHLPGNYSLALRLRDAGLTNDLIAECLAVERESDTPPAVERVAPRAVLQAAPAGDVDVLGLILDSLSAGFPSPGMLFDPDPRPLAAMAAINLLLVIVPTLLMGATLPILVSHLVHRSGPNRTEHRRIGLGISYIPTHVRCRCETRLSAMLVRGADGYGYFDDEPRPKTDYGAAERAFHAAAVARFREANREETLQYEGAAK